MTAARGSIFVTAMPPSAVDTAAGVAVKTFKPNVGVFTNPKHELWMNAARPTAESAAAGAELLEGEVTIAIRSTGICG